jgi:aminoglycoside phosphotransferase (APT) family kinase protein
MDKQSFEYRRSQSMARKRCQTAIDNEAMQQEIRSAIEQSGIGQGQALRHMVQLTGGVSSDIWRIDFEDHSVCAKRALAKLKVAADWHAPLSRNAYEYAWYEVISPLFPHAVPRMLGRDEASGMFFMSYLDADTHPVWKAQLLQGQINPTFAAQVGQTLGQMHAATAHNPKLAHRFQSDAEFHALRLEPYLLATAQRHPALAPRLHAIHQQTADGHLALVHGDISPKNILMGPQGPVFLDAECAWYGDPAFDLAFGLNHLLLKAVHMPQHQGLLADSFTQLSQAYLAHVNWEPVAVFEQRAAQLLPALLLARVDGKSPVEYLTSPHTQNQVRQIATHGLQHIYTHLQQVLATTLKALAP